MRSRAELYVSCKKVVELLDARTAKKETLATEIYRDYVRLCREAGVADPAEREEYFACRVCPSHLSRRDVEEHMQRHSSTGGVVCNQHPDIKIADLATFNHHLRIRHQ